MLRNKLVRSDGSIIDSSVIISCEYTEEVNCSTNLYFGDVTSSELSVEIRSTEAIQQGEILTYYMIEDGVETLIGKFIAEKPTVASRSSIRFSAYDNLSKTEKQFSGWLKDNQSLFPMTPRGLVTRVCSYCGVGYAGDDFPNQDITINAFYADDITCRQILAWVGALAGRFVRANAVGEIEFATYVENLANGISYKTGYANPVNIVVTDTNGNVVITSEDMVVADDGYGNVVATIDSIEVIDLNGNVTLARGAAIPFFEGSLSYETYQTDKIKRVQIKHSDDDVGVIYPANADGNCYSVSQNMLLGTCSLEDVTKVARNLYDQLSTVTYTPFSVRLPRTTKIRAGNIIALRDINGNSFISPVMKMSLAPDGVTISCTGDKTYDSSAAVASERFTNLTGKVLEMSKTVDGLVIRNQSLDGKVSGLELTTEEIKTYVETKLVTGETFEQYRSESVQTAKDFTQKFESLDQYRNETSANIKTGLLGHTEDNIPIYGMEIGQQTENADGENIFDKYARFTSEKLSFYDQNDNEVTQIGDKKMAVTNIEVTGSADDASGERGTFKHGGFVDVALADGTIVSKWIGGV